MKRSWNCTKKNGEVPRGLMLLVVRLYPEEEKPLAIQTESIMKSLVSCRK